MSMNEGLALDPYAACPVQSSTAFIFAESLDLHTSVDHSEWLHSKAMQKS